ncbi:hypothetical protein KY358_04245 [Candidatus Woesearchaeota archaeon]|nr:hypothetical protein [Candidatus Woesearchaeota archaeon]
MIENRIIIGDGRSSILGRDVTIFPINILILLQRYFTEKYGKKAGDIFYCAGNLQGRILFEDYLRSKGLPRDFNSFNNFLNVPEIFGYGSLKLKHYSLEERKMIIENSSSPFSRQYVKLFGFQKKSVDHYMRGFYSGIAEIIMGKRIVSVELSCRVKDEGSCITVIKPEIDFDKSKKLVREQIPENLICDGLYEKLIGARQHHNDHNKQELSQTEFSRRIIAHEQMYFKNGWFILMGICGFICNVEIFALISHLLYEAFGEEAREIFYELGEAQTEYGCKFQVETFGFDKLKFLESFVQQTEITGYGLVAIDTADFSNNRFGYKQERSLFSERYLQLFGRQENSSCSYVKGILAGMIKGITGREIEAHETRCRITGDDCCYYEVNSAEKGTNKGLIQPEIFKRILSPASFLPAE